jgi:hypothetical protein
LKPLSRVLLPHLVGPIKAVIVFFVEVQSHVSYGLELPVIQFPDVAIDKKWP